MSRGVWVYRNGTLVPKHLAPPLHVKHANAPGVISDCIDSTVNPANGKRYDSKSKYYKAVKDAGCSILGSNEMPSASPRPSLPDPGPDIARAMEKTA